MADRYRHQNRREPGGLRIGDAERDQVTGQLHEHYALGRLDATELDQRLNAALAAKTAGELERITFDLPGGSGELDAKTAKRMARLEKSAAKTAKRQASRGQLPGLRAGTSWPLPVTAVVLILAGIGAINVVAMMMPVLIVVGIVMLIVACTRRR